MLEILNDRNVFDLIGNDPIQKLQKSTFKVLNIFRVKCYPGNVKKCDIDTINSSLLTLWYN